MAETDTNTERLRATLRSLFQDAAKTGKSHVDVLAGDLHEATQFKPASHPNQMPSACNIMNEFKTVGDTTLSETPSGRSSTLKIRYLLPRKIWR